MKQLGRVLLIVLAALALAPAAHAGGPAMLVGTAEDAVKQPTEQAAKAKLDLLRLAGFNAIRLTETWTRGEAAPPESELQGLANVLAAAKLDAMEVFVAVFPFGSSQTPLTDQDRATFAGFAATVVRGLPGLANVIIGNEPNLNRFWLPQFNADGSDAAAPAFETLLGQTYDAVKAVAPGITVIGVGLSPRGGDRPGTGRDTHSPTVFIADLGAAYRASGRTAPIMDELSIHPYEDNSSTPPTYGHPDNTTISIADYGKLVSLLGQAFDGTAQPGSTLPILYGEFGVETQIPEAKASLYTGAEPATTKPVDEPTQASFYRQAIALAFCQPNVRGIMILHAFDETGLPQWQSGVYYADATPKTSLQAVAQAARDSHGGVIARCPDLQLTPRVQWAYPRGGALTKVPLRLSVTCDIDCNVYARLERWPTHSTTLAVSGHAQAGVKTPIDLPARRVRPGRYRFTLRLTAPLNVGLPAVVTSGVVTIR